MIDGSLVNLSPPSIKKIEVSFFPGCTGSFAETTDSVNTKIFKLVRSKDFFLFTFSAGTLPVLYSSASTVLHCTVPVWSHGHRSQVLNSTLSKREASLGAPGDWSVFSYGLLVGFGQKRNPATILSPHN